jgi:hypothetical protein
MNFSEGFGALLERADGPLFDVIDVFSVASMFNSCESPWFVYNSFVLSLVFSCRIVSVLPTSGLSATVGLSVELFIVVSTFSSMFEAVFVAILSMP